MLHPHVPEDLKHFSKHLFATFLGLLMALALESWREHRAEARMARDYQDRLVSGDFLQTNRKDLEERLAVIEREQPKLEAYAMAFADAARERQRGHAKALPAKPTVQGIDLSFIWSAWDMAKAVGVLRHLDPLRVQRFASVYSDMQRVQGVLDQMVLGPGFPGCVHLLPFGFRCAHAARTGAPARQPAVPRLAATRVPPDGPRDPQGAEGSPAGLSAPR